MLGDGGAAGAWYLLPPNIQLEEVGRRVPWGPEAGAGPGGPTLVTSWAELMEVDGTEQAPERWRYGRGGYHVGE